MKTVNKAKESSSALKEILNDTLHVLGKLFHADSDIILRRNTEQIKLI